MVVGLVRMDKGEIHLDDLDMSDLAMHEVHVRVLVIYLKKLLSLEN